MWSAQGYRRRSFSPRRLSLWTTSQHFENPSQSSRPTPLSPSLRAPVVPAAAAHPTTPAQLRRPAQSAQADGPQPQSSGVAQRSGARLHAHWAIWARIISGRGDFIFPNLLPFSYNSQKSFKLLNYVENSRNFQKFEPKILCNPWE
jgi:hypothetical protein